MENFEKLVQHLSVRGGRGVLAVGLNQRVAGRRAAVLSFLANRPVPA